MHCFRNLFLWYLANVFWLLSLFNLLSLCTFTDFDLQTWPTQMYLDLPHFPSFNCIVRMNCFEAHRYINIYYKKKRHGMSPPCLLFAIIFLLCAFNAFNAFWSLLDHEVMLKRKSTYKSWTISNRYHYFCSSFSIPHYLSLQTPIVQAMADMPSRMLSGTVTELKSSVGTVRLIP